MQVLNLFFAVDGNNSINFQFRRFFFFPRTDTRYCDKRARLDRLANRLTKILAEIRKLKIACTKMSRDWPVMA
jgi:hypothetical protein